MYPFDTKYPWVFGRSTETSEIEGAAYLQVIDKFHKQQLLKDCEPILLLKQIVNVRSAFDSSHMHSHYNYNTMNTVNTVNTVNTANTANRTNKENDDLEKFSNHCIFEDKDIKWNYGKRTLKYVQNENTNLSLSDNLIKNPAWNSFINNKFDDVSLYYLGGGVTDENIRQSNKININTKSGWKLLSDIINAKIKYINNNNNNNLKKQYIFTFSVDGNVEINPSIIHSFTESIRETLFFNNNFEMIVSSIYYIPINGSLGPSTAVVNCLNGFNYKDFMPLKNSVLSYSGGTSSNIHLNVNDDNIENIIKIRGLWHGLVYENDQNVDTNKKENTFCNSMAINYYPTKMTDKFMNKFEIKGDLLLIDSLGNLKTACRALKLAIKLECKHITIVGLPLGIAQLFYQFEKMNSNTNINNIITGTDNQIKDNTINKSKINLRIIVGGYLTPQYLFDYIKYLWNNTINSINASTNNRQIDSNIDFDCYYGTTDFMAGCMKCDKNMVNGFYITNINKNIVKPIIFKKLLYLSDNYTTICTNDKIAKLDNEKYYFETKNLLEEWLIYNWKHKYFKYLTGNMYIIQKNQNIFNLYLQCRDEIINTTNINALINDIIRKDKFFNIVLLSKYKKIDINILGFNEFEAKFNNFLSHNKPLYLIH